MDECRQKPLQPGGNCPPFIGSEYGGRRITPRPGRLAICEATIQKNPIVLAPQFQRPGFTERMRETIPRERKFADELGQFSRVNPVGIPMPKIATVNACHLVTDDTNNT